MIEKPIDIYVTDIWYSVFFFFQLIAEWCQKNEAFSCLFVKKTKWIIETNEKKGFSVN